MRLNKLVLRETGDLEKQFRRPFKPHLDGGILDDLEESMRSASSLSSIDSAMGEVAGRMLLPSDEYEEAKLHNVRSWRDRRFRFFADITVRDFSRHNTTCERMIVVGYTDRAEIGRNDTIDPDTEMVINSVIRLVGNLRKDHRGNVIESYRILEDSNILCAHDELATYDDLDDMEISLTPYNIFDAISAKDEDGDDWDPDGEIYSSAILSAEARSVRRRVNNPTNYLTALVQSDVTALTLAEEENGDMLFTPSRSNHARDICSDPDLRSNDFIRAIANHRDEMYDAKNAFYYEDLVIFTDNDLDELDDLTEVSLMATDDIDLESDRWSSAHPETLAAYAVVHAVPTIAIETLQEDVEFTVDNDNHENRPDFAIIHQQTYVEDSSGEPVDLDDSIIDRFEARVIHEVFNPLTRNGRHLVTLDVSCNIFGITRVEISIDDDNTRPYVFTSFADAMLSPVVSNSARTLKDFARDYSDIREVIDDVWGDKGNKAPRNPRNARRSSRRQGGSALDDI